MILLPLLTALLALAACDSEPEELSADEGAFSFLLNGESWVPNTTVHAGLTGEKRLGVFSELRFEDRFPLRQVAGLSVPFAGLGTYEIAERSVEGEFYSAYITEDDGDATIAFYRSTAHALPDGSEGRIVVAEYDEATGAVAGTFRGVFVVDSSDVRQPRRELPDTLVVTEGVFRATVDDRRGE